MAGKVKFDSEAAFKSIIGEGEPVQTAKKSTGKGRPKVDRETKKGIILALYPSSYSDLQKIAYVVRKSASNIISDFIEEYVAANADKLKEYEKIKPEKQK